MATVAPAASSSVTAARPESGRVSRPVGERVQVQALHTVAAGDVDERQEVALGGVHAAVAHQAHRCRARSRPIARACWTWGARSSSPEPIASSIRTSICGTRRPAPRLRWPTSLFAHLAVRQPHREPGGLQLRGRPLTGERVERRRAREGDRVPGTAGAIPNPSMTIRTSGPFTPRPPRSPRSLGVEARAAHQGAVDVRLRHELGRVGRRDAAAVQDLHPGGVEPAAGGGRTTAQVSCAMSGVAVRPVPIAQMGS